MFTQLKGFLKTISISISLSLLAQFLLPIGVFATTVPPTVTTTLNILTANNTPSISFNITDNASGIDLSTFRFHINGTTYTNTSSQINFNGGSTGSLNINGTFTPSTAFADGIYNYFIEIADLNKNTVIKNDTITIDTTAPVVNITLPVNGSTIPQLTPILTTNTIDVHNVTGTYQVDGIAPINCTSNLANFLTNSLILPNNTSTTDVLPSFSNLSNHTIYICEKDALGNASTPVSTNFTVNTAVPDTTAPVNVITSPLSSYINDSTPSISVLVNEVSSVTATYQIDGIAPVDCTLPLANALSIGGSFPTYIASATSASLSNGSHTLYICSRDTVLNNSSVSSTTFTVDTSVPTLSSVSISSNNITPTLAKTGDTITLSFTSSEDISGVIPTVRVLGNYASVVNIGGNIWQATYILKSTDAEGIVTFTIDFKDLAGNSGVTVTSVTNSSSVTFDRTAPVLSFIDNVEAGPVSSDTITGNWGNSTVKMWKYNINITCPVTFSSYTYTDTILINQTNTSNNGQYICLYGQDAAGNITTLVSVNDINITTFALSFSPSTYSTVEEGVNLTMTLQLTPAPSSPLSVIVTSGDTSALTVVSPVVVAAGATSVFVIATAIGDTDTTNEAVIVSASASGYTSSSATVNVTDNDSSVVTISNVNVEKKTYELIIEWNTNIPTTGVVEYGTTTSYGTSVNSSLSSTSHTVNLFPLDDDKTYYYRITATSTPYSSVYTNNIKTDSKTDENIMMTEIMYHPDNSTENGKEWVEIYNDGEDDEDLQHWIFEVDGTEYKIVKVYEVKTSSLKDITGDDEDSFVLEKNSYAIITDDADEFENEYDNIFDDILDVSSDVKVYEVDANFNLDNSEAQLQFLNPLSEKVDKVEYEDNWGNGDDDGDGYTLAKISLSGTNNDSNWDTSSEENGTPGMPNCTVDDYNVESCSENINNLTLSNITSATTETTATLSFTTNKTVTALVRYGTTTSNLNLFQSSTLKQSHVVNLTGLNKDTTYFYKIEAGTGSNQEISPLQSFKTASSTTPITTENLAVTILNIDTQETAATLKYTVQQSISTEVHYGLNSAYGMKKVSPQSSLHEVTLTSLIQDTTYHFQIQTASAKSQDFTFKTKKTNVSTINSVPTSTNQNTQGTLIQPSSGIKTPLPKTGVSTLLLILFVLTISFVVHKRIKKYLRGIKIQ